MQEFVCYIDESGDEGFSEKSSKTFAFSAVVIKKENDLLLPKFQKSILTQISQNKIQPLKNIHFADLKHEQRKYLCNKILENKIPFRAIVVLSNKFNIDDKNQQNFNQNKWAYFNYLARHLLERVSWLVRDESSNCGKKGNVNIVFSNRKQMKIEKIRQYLMELKEEKNISIEWDVIGNIDVKNHEQLAGLQFADVFATAFRRYGYEGDRLGVETSYIKILQPFLYKHGSKIPNYGIKIRGLNYHELTEETIQMLKLFGF